MDDGGVVVGCLSLHGRQQPVTISELALYLLNESRHQDVEVEDKLNFLKEKEKKTKKTFTLDSRKVFYKCF